MVKYKPNGRFNMKNQERREKTRALIMETAGQYFAQKGYSATGVAEICKACGVSKGAFYYHFESKSALFLALLEEWMGNLDRSLDAMSSGAGNISEILFNMSKMLGSIFQSYRHQLPILLDFWMQATRDEEVWKATYAPFEKYHTYFAHLIQKGIDQGNLEPVDPSAGAQAMISLAVGLLLQGLLSPETDSWGKVSRESFQILLSGIIRRGA